MSKKLELVGKKFGRLLVQREAGRTKHKALLWRCLCSCGNEVIISGNSLMREKTKSCGCLHKEINATASITHGLRYSSEYRVWTLMKNRCLNQNASNYEYYGGRGITVCKRWLTFENFYADMGEKPIPSLTIERIHNDKGYYPRNCIWATREIQARNRRMSNRNTSGVQGVSWHKRVNKYQARITVKSKDIFLGYYHDIIEAIAARRAAELKYWEGFIDYRLTS